ncbi:DNA primase catalytic core [Marmoricola sp. URHA0025 HA25]
MTSSTPPPPPADSAGSRAADTAAHAVENVGSHDSARTREIASGHELHGTGLERARLVAAHEDAAEFYRRMLLGPEGAGPRRYLVDRGFEALLDDTPWTVGYAPTGWTRLHEHLTSLGYNDQTLLVAGLIRLNRRGDPIDCFRDRITFGIRDTDHALVGFTGRCAPDSPAHVPKYLNTPATPIYNKSHLLFGLGEATRTQPATAILTEGPLDAIAVELSTDANTTHAAALALCGTATTDDHRSAIRSLGAEQVILAFDADPAGARARENAYRTLRGAVDIKALEGLQGTDLAETFQTAGPSGLNSLLSTPRRAIDVIVDARLALWTDASNNAEIAVAAVRDLARLLAYLEPTDMAGHAIRLSVAVGLPTPVVTRELANAITASAPRTNATTLHAARVHVASL